MGLTWGEIAILLFLFAALKLAYWAYLDDQKHKAELKQKDEQYNRTNNLIKELAASKPRFYWNKINDILALCTAESFDKALVAYHEDLEKKKVQPWDKVVLQPVPTFTFSRDEQSYRPIHTGTMEDFEKFQKRLFSIVTEMERKDMSDHQHSAILSWTVRHDTRLYVPYASDTNVFPLSAQHKHFGTTTLEQLQETIERTQ